MRQPGSIEEALRTCEAIASEESRGTAAWLLLGTYGGLDKALSACSWHDKAAPLVATSVAVLAGLPTSNAVTDLVTHSFISTPE